MTDTTTSEESHSPLACAACGAIDAQDGTADGQLFTDAAAKYHVKSESHIWQSVKDTQDRVADHVTKFAGSLKFVYLHSVWFRRVCHAGVESGLLVV